MISLVVGTLSPQIRVLAAVRGDEVQIHDENQVLENLYGPEMRLDFDFGVLGVC